jgi:hypothetical protein
MRDFARVFFTHVIITKIVETTMTISIQCSCGKVYSLPDSTAGKVATCKACSAKINIPLAVPQDPKQSISAAKSSAFPYTRWAVLGSCGILFIATVVGIVWLFIPGKEAANARGLNAQRDPQNVATNSLKSDPKSTENPVTPTALKPKSLVRLLAERAPEFDPANPPKPVSGLSHRLRANYLPNDQIEVIEKLSRGEPCEAGDLRNKLAMYSLGLIPYSRLKPIFEAIDVGPTSSNPPDPWLAKGGPQWDAIQSDRPSSFLYGFETPIADNADTLYPVGTSTAGLDAIPDRSKASQLVPSQG